MGVTDDENMDTDRLLSNDRTTRREDGTKISSHEMQIRRLDSFMSPLSSSEETTNATPQDGQDASSPKDSPDVAKCKLAFEEQEQRYTDSAVDLEKEPQSTSPRLEAPAPKPRSNRTTATKISAALISKIENNESGCDLKITALIPFDHLSQLCQALAKNESTERLDLEGCGVGDKGCVLIRDLLIGNKVIKHVDLQMNQITDVGCRYLAEILPRNGTLQKLYLGYNDIRDEGVYAVISAMRPRGQLEVVVNGNTHVSDQALARLDRALDQQWRSVPKPKKEISVNENQRGESNSSPKTSTRSRTRGEEKECKEEEGVGGESSDKPPKRPRFRNDLDAPKTSLQKKFCGFTLHEDVVLGPPFDFKLVSTEGVGSEPPPLSHPHHQPPAYTSEQEQGPNEAKRTEGSRHLLRAHLLRARFHAQWARFRNAVTELLTQEGRDLSLPTPLKSPFQSACRFLSTQLSAKSAMRTQSSNACEERARWQDAIKSGQLCEDDRRKSVERRVHALLLKFRHMEEDILRQQKGEVMSFLVAQSALAQAEDQGNYTALVLPCPFRIQISFSHFPGILTN